MTVNYRCLMRACVFVAMVMTCLPQSAVAQAHFAPALANIRDYALPEPGLYVGVYDMQYLTRRLVDDAGRRVSSLVIGRPTGPTTTLRFETDVQLFATAPMLLWISDRKVAGARYGAYALPSFSSNSIAASLTTIRGRGINPSSGQFALGDLYVQPVWLGWNRGHVDAAAGYGFYAPIGKYDVETITLPVVGPISVTAVDNVGLGYWTHQVQGNLTWYSNERRETAVTNTVTAEFNGNQRDFDVSEGNYVTWNWGVSRIGAFSATPTNLLEVGVSGYDQWQTSDTTGADAPRFNDRREAHAVGVQVGMIHVPWDTQVTFRMLYEYAAENRLQGLTYCVNFGHTLRKHKPVAQP